MATPHAPEPARKRPRVHLLTHFPDPYEAMEGLGAVIAEGGLDPALVELVKIRASQINGCAYCIDMHTKDARAMGESDERMHLLNAWRESRAFSEDERAALALCEAMTLVTDGHVPDDVFAAAEAQFEPAQLVALIWQCAAINAWNRVAIAVGSIPGRYRSTREPVERPAS